MFGNQSRRNFLKLAASGTAMFTPGLLTGSANAQNVPTLTVAWGTDIDSFDPAQFKSDGAYIVQANIYDTLLSWGAEPLAGSPSLAISKPGVFTSGIGESWTYENGNKTLVVKIRGGLKFPSGRPVDANAVKYLFDRGLQSSGYMRLIFPTMVGVTEADQFEVRDNNTFAINLPAPSAMLLDVLALSNNALLDPEEIKLHATADDPWAAQWLKRNTAGLGPYKICQERTGRRGGPGSDPRILGAAPVFQAHRHQIHGE
ncbi:ABC-type transport system substrate-binding protein [Bradyrhizobium sp. LM2.7]